MSARNVSIEMVANSLASSFDKPVLDRTGLTGHYDLTIEWTPETTTDTNPSNDASGTTYLEALKEQLGLKLDSTTASVAQLFVDHIEEPSPN